MSKKKKDKDSTVEKVGLAWTIVMSIVGLVCAGLLIALGVNIVQWLRGG